MNLRFPKKSLRNDLSMRTVSFLMSQIHEGENTPRVLPGNSRPQVPKIERASLMVGLLPFLEPVRELVFWGWDLDDFRPGTVPHLDFIRFGKPTENGYIKCGLSQN